VKPARGARAAVVRRGRGGGVWRLGRSARTLSAAVVVGVIAPAAVAQPGDVDAWPWAAVARVLRDGDGPCSGVLVAPRTVLTVGHCVARRNPWRAEAAARLSVRFGGAAFAVEAVRLARTSPFGADGALAALHHDWAVLELAAAPAVAPVPYHGGRAARLAFVLDTAVSKMGWAGGARVRDDGCRIRHLDRDARAFAFACGGGAGRGRSGSALIAATVDGYAVIAVQSAVGRTGAGRVGLAVSPEPALVVP